jgi:secreted trypsin-like serine protease
MKAATALLVAASATATFVQGADIQPLIIGGSIVPAGQKTYTVGLRETAKSENQCGGSLISLTHVLTATHCNPSKYVSIGSHSLNGSKDGERICVKKETVHPLWDNMTATYDYRLVELATPSKFTPIKLLAADSEKYAGEIATVMGWGYTSADEVPSKELVRLNVPVLTRAQCDAAYPGIISVTEMCAGGKKNKDACSGDSGGPLILEQSTGDVLVGVMSWGQVCGTKDKAKPGVYSRVSYVKSWIQEVAPNAVFV